jgi:hypothetical protein
MIKWNPLIAKETSIHVLMGTLINYPLNILFLYVIIDLWNITEPFWISNIVTVWFSIVAFCRIYVVRYITEQLKFKKLNDGEVNER